MSKTLLKKLRHWFGDLLVNVFITYLILIFRCLPPQTLVFISKIAGSIIFHLFKKYRERVIGNLSIAFQGEKDPGDVKELAREIFFHFTLTPLETIYMIANPLERFILKINIKGREYLDAALAKGNGVVALGAHLGSFPLLGVRLTAEGYRLNAIINEANFPRLMNRINAYGRKMSQNLFFPKPATTSVKKSLNCLHRNEILYLVADEQQRRGGLPVPFFGQKAFTAPGPAIFSIKTGAPILPMFVLRGNGIERTLVIGTPIEIERTSDEKKDVEVLTGKFTGAIEEAVRRYPSQWAWLNRRWKAPPQESGQ